MQAFGHCVGSVSLQMAILAGLQGIRTAVCAQFPLHPASSVFNMVKAQIHTADVIGGLGIDGLPPDTRPSFRDELLDIAMRALPMPAEEHCGQAVCRWINAIYGCTHRHAQLNDATHQALNEMFGFGNIESLEHLSLMMRKGLAVTHSGGMDYFEHPERMAGTRLLLLQGIAELHLPPGRLAPDLALAADPNPRGDYQRKVLPATRTSTRSSGPGPRPTCTRRSRSSSQAVTRRQRRRAGPVSPAGGPGPTIVASPSSSAVRSADAVSARRPLGVAGLRRAATAPGRRPPR